VAKGVIYRQFLEAGSISILFAALAH